MARWGRFRHILGQGFPVCVSIAAYRAPFPPTAHRTGQADSRRPRHWAMPVSSFPSPPVTRPRRPTSPRPRRSSPGWIRSCVSGTTGHFTSRQVVQPRPARSSGSPTGSHRGTASSSAVSSTSPARRLLHRADNARPVTGYVVADRSWIAGESGQGRGSAGRPWRDQHQRHRGRRLEPLTLVRRPRRSITASMNLPTYHPNRSYQSCFETASCR